MEFDQIIKQLTAAKDDADALKLATVDIVLSTHEPELKKVLEAAAIPHWFDDDILVGLLNEDIDNVTRWFQQIQTLPFVESFKSRNGFNVHEATRLALRKRFFMDDPEQLHKLSARAVEIFSANIPVQQVEKIYHQLVSLPKTGADELERLWKQWYDAGRFEQLQALANTLRELLDAGQLQSPARARSLICYNWVCQATLTSKEFENNANNALQLFVELNHPAGQVDAYDQLGDVFIVQGKLAEAMPAYQEALKIMQQLSDADPDNRSWLRDLSISYNKIGSVLEAQGKLAEAMLAYLENKNIIQQLTEADTDNSDWLRGLSISYGNIGGVLLVQGKLSDAMSAYQEGKKIKQQLTEADPANSVWQRDLSISYNTIGEIFKAQGKLAEAKKEFKASYEIRRRLVAQDSTNAVWQKDLENVLSWLEFLDK